MPNSNRIIFWGKAFSFACIGLGGIASGQSSVDSRMRFSGFYLGMPAKSALEKAQGLNNGQREPSSSIDECRRMLELGTAKQVKCGLELSDANALGGYSSLTYTFYFGAGKLTGFTVSIFGNQYYLRDLVASFRNRMGEAGRRDLREIAGVVVEDNCQSDGVSGLKCRVTRWTGEQNNAMLSTKLGLGDDGLPYTSAMIIVSPRGKNFRD